MESTIPDLNSTPSVAPIVLECSQPGLNEDNEATGVEVIEGASSPAAAELLGSAADDDLSGIIVKSVDEAFELYNNYAFRIGFSVRKGKQRYRADGTISMKKFFCYKQGLKDKTAKSDKCYSKLEVRTDCGACVQFDVDRDGLWILTKHKQEHNHPLCPSGAIHNLRSHRRISRTQLNYLKELKKSGIGRRKFGFCCCLFEY